MNVRVIIYRLRARTICRIKLLFFIKTLIIIQIFSYSWVDDVTTGEIRGTNVAFCRVITVPCPYEVKIRVKDGFFVLQIIARSTFIGSKPLNQEFNGFLPISLSTKEVSIGRWISHISIFF